jgi:hypothetical protein
MLKASDYRKRLRKVITLPSGGEVEIRKLSASDFLSAGEIPLAFQMAIRNEDKAAAEAAMKADAGLAKRINNAVLINGVVSMKIVDKSPRDCAEDEISVQEIDPTDHSFIIEQISSLNNMTPEAGKSIRRFPEESGAPGDGGRDGASVRETADGDS